MVNTFKLQSLITLKQKLIQEEMTMTYHLFLESRLYIHTGVLHRRGWCESTLPDTYTNPDISQFLAPSLLRDDCS